MIAEYEENNPLSQLAFIFLRDKKATIIKHFDATLDNIKKKFTKIISQYQDNQEFNLHNTLQMKTRTENEPFGQISLVKGLQSCKQLFLDSPMYYYKEVYAILSSSNTIDGEDCYTILQYFKNHRIRISILSLNCSLYFYEKVVETCKGELAVPINKEEMENYIFKISDALFIQTSSKIDCNFSVSFPSLKILKGLIICMCHKRIM